VDLVPLGENIDPFWVMQQQHNTIVTSLVALHLELLVCHILLVSLWCSSCEVDPVGLPVCADDIHALLMPGRLNSSDVPQLFFLSLLVVVVLVLLQMFFLLHFELLL
jgi:hypothetical protein